MHIFAYSITYNFAEQCDTKTDWFITKDLGGSWCTMAMWYDVFICHSHEFASNDICDVKG